MKLSIAILLLAASSLVSASSTKSNSRTNVKMYATCRGDNPCNACKNCKYCKRCAKQGLTCGVCKK